MANVFTACWTMSDAALGGNAGARTDTLQNVALAADTQLKISGRAAGGAFTRMLIVPEYFFNAGGGGGLLGRDDKHAIYRRLEQVSAMVPDLVLIGGSIAYGKGIIFKDTYNVCPVLLGGQIIAKLYKSNDDGVYQVNGTFRTKTDAGKATPIVQLPNGLRVGLDICMDYNRNRLGDYIQLHPPRPGHPCPDQRHQHDGYALSPGEGERRVHPLRSRRQGRGRRHRLARHSAERRDGSRGDAYHARPDAAARDRPADVLHHPGLEFHRHRLWRTRRGRCPPRGSSGGDERNVHAHRLGPKILLQRPGADVVHRRARPACERLDIGHKYGGNDTPEFLAMNPNGTVPVLRDGEGEPIFETGAILRYLATRYARAPFWPEDLAARTQVDMWTEWSKINIALNFTAPIFWRVVRTAPRDRDEAAIRQAVAVLARKLDIAEARLKRRLFLRGTTSR